ncbi:UDP-N-acetylglucosamine pyrophosphorylase [Pseudoramibacter alactolyticus]|jgi:NDP-sugar pyrophosphorylase family protein
MIKIQDLFDLEHSMAKGFLERLTYPWEALADLSDWIVTTGKNLNPELYEERAEHVWVHKTAEVMPSAFLGAPSIIGPRTQVRHGAFIRGSALVGADCVVGNSAELKNVILFDNVETPHYNYVGDSILGFHAHMGAGSITSNVKADRQNITIKTAEGALETGLRKIGAMVGDWVEVGCNAVLNPGTIIGPRTNIYPTVSLRGVIPADHIVKDSGTVVPKR